MTARRVRLPVLEALPPKSAELEAAGWERRFMADPERAKEATELYTSMGYEVRAEPLTPEQFDEQCGDCPSDVCRVHVLIYTRRSP